MKTQNLLGIMLAATVALAGCAQPMQSGLPASGTQKPSGSASATQPATGVRLAPPQQAAATQNSQATADAMNDEQDMNAYDAMASEEAAAAYNVLMVGAEAPPEGMVGITMVGAETPPEGMVGITATLDGEVKAGAKNPLLGRQRLNDKQKAATEKLLKAKAKQEELKKKQEERRVKQSEHLAKRLDKMKDARINLKGAFKKAAWVAGEAAGTEQKSFSFDESRTINGKTTSRSVEMIRVRSKETKVLLSAHVSFEQELGNGLTRTSTRDKVLQEDGSYLVTFHSEITHKDGAKRVADWTKTIGADGSVTGTGTIVWTDKDGKTSTKTVTLAFSGKEEAEKAKVVDAETKTEAEVAVNAGGEITAAVTDTQTNTQATVEVKADADAEVSAGTPQGIAVGEPNPAAPAEEQK